MQERSLAHNKEIKNVIMNKQEKILNLFVSKKETELRPLLLNPFIYNGKIYATDSMILIRTDDSNNYKSNNPYQPIKKVEKVIPKKNTEEIISLNEEMFEKFRTEEEVEYGEYLDCSCCNGEGDVDWKYKGNTMRAKCPVCDGSGISDERKKKKTGKIILNPKALVKFKNKYFNLVRFYKLLEAQKLIGEEIKLISTIYPFLFSIGNYEIIIMPMNLEKTTTKEILEI